MSLYLKHRPSKVSELDLKSVRVTLKQIIESNKVAHAYLFTGPRGSGKTSSARIVAKVVNCTRSEDKLGEPCNKCSACTAITEGSAVDVIEIDAASNRGIDDIRELKQKIRLAPSSLRKKVYIIDEVHMLTKEAFNALLKTLEEPPDHSIFILCTTESHKIPETIASRCTRVSFEKADSKEMMRALKRVVKKEGAKAEEGALEYLAVRVDGSFRDGVKVLDQVITGGTITVVQIQEILHGASGFVAKEWVEKLVERDAVGSLEKLKEIEKEGVNLVHAITESMLYLRDIVMAKYGGAKVEIEGGEELIPLIYKMDETVRLVKTSSVPYVLIEMMVIDWCGVGREKSGEDDEGGANRGEEYGSTKNKKVEKNKKKAQKSETEKVEDALESISIKRETKQKPEKKKAAKQKERANIEIDEKIVREKWKSLMKKVVKSSYSLEALLSKASPRGIENNEMVIEVRFDFHKQQLESERFRKLLEQLVEEVYEFPLRCRFELGDRVSELSVEDLRSMGSNDNMPQAQVEQTDAADGDEELIAAAEDIFVN